MSKRKPKIKQSKTSKAKDVDTRGPKFVQLNDNSSSKKTKPKKVKPKKKTNLKNKNPKTTKQDSKKDNKKKNARIRAKTVATTKEKPSKTVKPTRKSTLKVTNNTNKSRAKSVSPKSNGSTPKSNKSSKSPQKTPKKFKFGFFNRKDKSPAPPIDQKAPVQKKTPFWKRKKKNVRSNSTESIAQIVVQSKQKKEVKKDQEDLDAFESFIKAQQKKQKPKEEIKEKESKDEDDAFEKAFDEEWDKYETKSVDSNDSKSSKGKKKDKKHKSKKDKSEKKHKSKHKKKSLGSPTDVNKRNEFKPKEAWHHKKRSSLPTYTKMKHRKETLQFHLDKERQRNLAVLNYDTDKRKKSKEYKNLAGGGFQIRVNYRYRLDDGRIGVCRFKGRTLFGKSYEDWIGLVLEHGEGEHDGTVQGKSYFKCRPGKGIMVEPSRVIDNLGSATKPLTKEMIKNSGKLKVKHEDDTEKKDEDGRWSAENYKEDHGGSVLGQKNFYSPSQLDLHVRKGITPKKKKRHYEV